MSSTHRRFLYHLKSRLHIRRLLPSPFLPFPASDQDDSELAPALDRSEETPATLPPLVSISPSSAKDNRDHGAAKAKAAVGLDSRPPPFQTRRELAPICLAYQTPTRGYPRCAPISDRVRPPFSVSQRIVRIAADSNRACQ